MSSGSVTLKIIHCSYHKCITNYYQKIFNNYFDSIDEPGEYKHFKSELNSFLKFSDKHLISSINNHYIDIDPRGRKISRFIRDPRDLVVSGYFYHKKGTEAWTKIIDPLEADWMSVNGTLPRDLKRGESFSMLLNRLEKDDGMIAQIEFRKKHFESMRLWPDSKNVLLFKYEEILGRELEVFSQLARFYGFDAQQEKVLLRFVDKYSVAKNIGKSPHIRNPEPSQWQKHFSPKVESFFNNLYEDIVIKYGY